MRASTPVEEGPPIANVLSRLHHHAKTRPTAPAYFHKVGGEWIATSWSDFCDEVRQAARALIALGLEPGETVGILGFNRPEWTSTVLATMAAGGAAAGIYTTSSPAQVAWLLEHARSRLVVVEDAAQFAKVAQVRERLPHLEHVVVMEGDVREAPSWTSFLDRGREVFEARLDARLRDLTGDQLATLIYTSGTTGTPKGVMLSHDNVFKTVKILAETFTLLPGDSSLSYLPLAHVAEQMISIHLATHVGNTVYYAESPEKIAENLREVRPTLFFGVPRVWERFHDGIKARLAEATAARRKLADWALGVERRAHEIEHGGARPGLGIDLGRRLADQLVAKKVRAALGFDRLRLAASGAAPIASEILHFFAGLGITIREVYGLSETSGPVSWNRPGRTRLGTVGPAIEEVEINLAEDGEVLVKGPNVFKGYLNDEAATAEVFDEEGFFYTGDLGSLDEEGFLTITGRKKDLIITTGGKNVSPASIETALEQIDLIGDAVAVGDGRRYIVALLSLDPAAVERFAHDRGLDVASEPHRDPAVREAVGRAVEEVNGTLSRVESVRDFRFLPRRLSIEEGELTPTLKVRRGAVLERWSELIEDMYHET